jgi:hypothetical protein
MPGEIDASLIVQLGQACDRLGKAAADLAYPPRAIHIQGSLTGIGSGTAVTTIPGPEGGKEWHLRRLTFAPNLGIACGTQGTILVGLSAGAPTNAQGSGTLVGQSQIIEVARTPQGSSTVGGAPGYFTFSHSQVVIRPPLNIVVCWVSGTDKCPLILDGEVEEILLGSDPDS